jgi:glycosyltransferase involved in cell wall biosynthesis
MPKVLHIGPCETPGGMANVMRILAEYPPEGWQAETLSSHTNGSSFAKWFAYRRARGALARMLSDEEQRPDIVHLHTAADWSWWRKRRFAKMAYRAGVPNIVHIHSGQFDTWLGAPDSQRSRTLKMFLKATQSQTVVLGDGWKQVLEPYIGPVHAINNPVDTNIHPSPVEREPFHLLLLGRNDPIKGHEFAIKVCEKVREIHPQLKVTMTGISTSPHAWLSAKGWISESEKLHLLQTATLLLVPSAFEGQPLVVLEALTCGLQVLVSDRIPLLSEGIIRAPFENVEIWVSKVIEMLDEPVKSSQLIAQSASFSVENISQQWGFLYSKNLIGK